MRTTHKIKTPKEKEVKKLQKIKEEILVSNDSPEVKQFRMNILERVGWGPYMSWFSNKTILNRSGWNVIYIPNEWVKMMMKRNFKSLLEKQKAILHVED